MKAKGVMIWGFVTMLLLCSMSTVMAYHPIIHSYETYWSISEPVKTERYEVKNGDTLWDIAATYATSVEELMELNLLEDSLIQAGQSLLIPVSSKNNEEDTSAKKKQPKEAKEEKKSYTVKGGDTLWQIASKHQVSVSSLQKENKLTSNLLRPGQKLVIPTIATAQSDRKETDLSRAASVEVDQNSNSASSKISHTQQDYEWLAKIIEAEAENEPYLGKVAVGSVVINRVESKSFPNSIQDVIFQKTKTTYQFSPVGNGRINRVSPSEDSYKAATAALNGEDPTNGAIYFYNPRISTSQWIFTRTVITEIGQHRFAY